MTTGFGVDPVVDGSGNPTAGMSALDVRKVFGGLFPIKGIITGGVVSTTGGLNYTVSAGVAAIDAGSGEVVLAPIPAGTVATGAVTANRTDIVYAKQNYVADGNVEVVLGVASGTSPTLPARAVALKTFTLASGITKTSDAVSSGGVDYAIPYGASLGLLHSHRNTALGTFTAMQTFGVGTFYLPTDRRVRVNLQTNLSANGAVGFDNSKYCEVYFNIITDGIQTWRWNTPGLHQSNATFGWTDMITLNKGWHTIGYDRYKTGSGTPYHWYQATGLGGTLFWVEDMGPSV